MFKLLKRNSKGNKDIKFNTGWDICQIYKSI